MYHPIIFHSCNVLEVAPSKWLISKALISLFFYFWSWFHNDKHFNKVKRGLALQKKMTKHYAKKNMLACAKLKEALMELENLKREKEHDSLRILVEDYHHVSKTS